MRFPIGLDLTLEGRVRHGATLFGRGGVLSASDFLAVSLYHRREIKRERE